MRALELSFHSSLLLLSSAPELILPVRDEGLTGNVQSSSGELMASQFFISNDSSAFIVIDQDSKKLTTHNLPIKYAAV